MKKALLAFLLSLMTFAAASAQRFEITATGMYPRFSKAGSGSADTVAPQTNDTQLTGLYGVGAQLTKNTKGYWGVELGYSRSFADFYSTTRTTVNDVNIPTRAVDRIRVQQANFNAISYFMPAGARWRPFVTGGLQAAQYASPNVPGWPGGGSRNYGGNFGGGLKLLLAKHILFRWDFRDYIGGKPYKQLAQFEGGHGHNLEASFGIGIGF
jgi:hypothetical protein